MLCSAVQLPFILTELWTVFAYTMAPAQHYQFLMNLLLFRFLTISIRPEQCSTGSTEESSRPFLTSSHAAVSWKLLGTDFSIPWRPESTDAKARKM